MALVAIDQEDWRASFFWLFACLLIDGIDGTLARRFKVSEVLPQIDGQSIDYVIDFVTYAVIPIFFFYKAGMVSPDRMIIAILVMLLSSALYYGKRQMVVDHEYFEGFPVLWNVLVFYLFFVFQNDPLINMTVVIIFGILHFVPIRFAYPSRTKKYFFPHLIISAIGLAGTLAVLYQYPSKSQLGSIATIVTGIYFGIFVILDTKRTLKSS